jgi:hypothetical protein
MSLRATDSWTKAEKDCARGILLESSPDGELVGRDPRKVTAAEFAAATLGDKPILKVIRAKCMDCCAEQEAEVRRCVVVTCPNWPYRMGANPFRTRELTDEQRAEIGRRLSGRNRAATVFSPIATGAEISPTASGPPS